MFLKEKSLFTWKNLPRVDFKKSFVGKAYLLFQIAHTVNQAKTFSCKRGNFFNQTNYAHAGALSIAFPTKLEKICSTI